MASFFGIEIRRKKTGTGVAYQQLHDPSSSYMLTEDLRLRLNDELAAIADKILNHHLSDVIESHIDCSEEVRHFFKMYRARPFGPNKGGSGFHNSFWLYMFSRAFHPKIIVESGAWKGHSSWLLQNACPSADVYSFDISLSKLECNDSRIKFFEMDWDNYDFGAIDGERSFIFFDCHVNHAKRILEAHKKGFRYLLFDDNPPAHNLYAYGLPGLPTAEMVYMGDVFPKEISWLWQGKERSFTICNEELLNAKKLIENYIIFPDVGGFTKYGGYSFLTYIKLHD